MDIDFAYRAAETFVLCAAVITFTISQTKNALWMNSSYPICTVCNRLTETFQWMRVIPHDSECRYYLIKVNTDREYRFRHMTVNIRTLSYNSKYLYHSSYPICTVCNRLTETFQWMRVIPHDSECRYYLMKVNTDTITWPWIPIPSHDSEYTDPII